MAATQPQTKTFTHDLKLCSHSSPAGLSVPLNLAYRTYGSPSNAAHNAVMLPTCYGGHLENTLPFLYTSTSPSKLPVLDPAKYFVIVVGLLGGSESSSPSNAAAPYSAANFPKTSYEDNIRLQHALATSLGVEKLRAYIGFSMAGQQAYHMAALFPSFVSQIVVLAGSARTSYQNWSFLEGPKAALVNSADFYDGRYDKPAKKGVGAFGRVYVTWARSQPWFREKCWEQCGCTSLEEYIKRDWEERFAEVWDANDLLCLLQTWQKGDITLYYPEDKGDLAKTLARIEARCLIMPARTDMYFPPEDNEEEVKHLKDGTYKPIETIWGHMAGGGGGTAEDSEFIASTIGQWLR